MILLTNLQHITYKLTILCLSMSDSIKTTLLHFVESFSYYLVDEARKEFGKNVEDIQIQDIEYRKEAGRYGEVYVIDVFYSSTFGSHKTKLAIKFMEDTNDILTEIKNSALLEKNFVSRSIVRVPRYIYVNLQTPSFIAYEGMEGISYEDATQISDKSFWAGYVLSIIHGREPRKVISDIYEEMFRRLVLAIFGGHDSEQEIMEKSKILIQMMNESSGGCDSFGDFHQSNLLVRGTQKGDLLSIALIDPTFWMEGSFDRFEDIGTFFGRQAIVEFRKTHDFEVVAEDIREFLKGYNVHLKEVKAPLLAEIYPKGYPLDLFLAIWAMMDIMDKTNTLNIPKNHQDIVSLKNMAQYCLITHPMRTKINP